MTAAQTEVIREQVRNLCKLLSPQETAERLGLSPKTLEKWRSLGTPRLPFVRLNSAIKYLESDIEQFINDSVVGREKPKRRRRAA